MSETREGVCIWMTGRSGAGKTTVTDLLAPMLEERGHTITILDTVPLLAKAPGERTSEGKLMRKAFVASEIVRHGGVAICVTVSARRSVREKAREVVGAANFVEVFFDVPPELAEQRRVQRGSRRSLAKRVKDLVRPLARLVSPRYRGGYERPEAADVTVDPSRPPVEGAEAILAVLESRDLLRSGSRPETPSGDDARAGGRAPQPG